MKRPTTAGVCVCVCVCTVHVCICAYACACMCESVHACVCVCVCVNTCKFEVAFIIDRVNVHIHSMFPLVLATM